MLFMNFCIVGRIYCDIHSRVIDHPTNIAIIAIFVGERLVYTTYIATSQDFAIVTGNIIVT